MVTCLTCKRNAIDRIFDDSHGMGPKIGGESKRREVTSCTSNAPVLETTIARSQSEATFDFVLCETFILSKIIIRPYGDMSQSREKIILDFNPKTSFILPELAESSRLLELRVNCPC